MSPNDFEKHIEARLAAAPSAKELQELAALRRAVVHAAVEMRMLLDTAAGQGYQTPQAVSFQQGVSAAIDTVDTTFRRHLSNINPSQYAHALERSYEFERGKKLEAIAIIENLRAGLPADEKLLDQWLHDNNT